MAEIFVSYAREDEPQAQNVADALRSHGYSVWRDDELPAHRAYADVIEERLKSAKAVVVLWSAQAAKSQWVRSEAEAARQLSTLVQATLDGLVPPMPFDQIQCADLCGWTGDNDIPGWRKLIGSITALANPTEEEVAKKGQPHKHLISVCVLPFANMSGDVEQEYFSDGISEDITTDLSKVSALAVTSRNIAFMFKGTAIDVIDVARKLGVSHVLEGSVRKAGNRVRITAQLIDGATGDHVWADRYDRDLIDIFEIQDEISKAIVDALKVKLLPVERSAIESRGTSNVEAYNLYLMARQQWIHGAQGDLRRDNAIRRFCEQAVALDAQYAQAWALMGLAQLELRFVHGVEENGLPAAERALEINPDLAEALSIKARYLEEAGRAEEAEEQIQTALTLDPESWEVNREAAGMLFRSGCVRESIPYFAKAASLMDTDWRDAAMLVCCYHGIGDHDQALEAAKVTAVRSKAVVAKDPTNCAALAMGSVALAIVGEQARAQDWARRALLLDPDNLGTRYNMACALAQYLNDTEGALEILQPYFERTNSTTLMRHIDVDPDLDPIRNDPRFKEMVATAKKRLGMQTATG